MQIGFVGLGDVGSRFSSGVADFGKADVVGYDTRLGLKEFSDKEERCRKVLISSHFQTSFVMLLI